MHHIDRWYYALIFLMSLVVIAGLTCRLVRGGHLASAGQKLIFAALIFYSMGGLLSSIQDELGVDGFRWGWSSYSVGVICMAAYFAEPWSHQKKRWTRDSDLFSKREDKP